MVFSMLTACVIALFAILPFSSGTLLRIFLDHALTVLKLFKSHRLVYVQHGLQAGPTQLHGPL